MFEKDAKEYAIGLTYPKFQDNQIANIVLRDVEGGFQKGAEFGYNKANEENGSKCKTAYIKGIKTMANALKDYDRTEGAWTDYFEHTVEKVLKRLLKESE